MSAADFLLSPDVQKLLKALFAEPAKAFTPAELAKRSKLDAPAVEATLAHLVGSGILKRSRPPAGEEAAATVAVDTSFVFHDELRRIALKSFAAAEPLRAMLRAKFKDSVLRAFLLGEDAAGTLALLLVHGRQVPDPAAMAAACRKLSASLGRHLEVHVIADRKFAALSPHEGFGRRLAAGSAIELIAAGDTRAEPSPERSGGLGLLHSARSKLAALGR